MKYTFSPLNYTDPTKTIQDIIFDFVYALERTPKGHTEIISKMFNSCSRELKTWTSDEIPRKFTFRK
jgi:hypothetical protein